MNLLRFGGLALLALAWANTASAQDSALFGHADKEAGGLIAIIYDLKQTQARQPSNVSADSYVGIVKDFMLKGWDEQVLNRYFRITRPLYSTQIFIPRIDAAAAPKAYGVEKIIQPMLWVIHYKGQVSPPEDGTYRFVGYADDILAVAVNSKTVCVSGRPDMRTENVWKSTEAPGAEAFNGHLAYGDWVPLKKDQPFDLDVLVGERPGGEFCAFLQYQKQGDTYAKDKEGKLILPVFQLQPQPIQVKIREQAPPFALGPQPWQQHR